MFWLNAFVNTTCKILQFVYHNISMITVTNFIAVHFTKKKKLIVVIFQNMAR